MRTQVQNDPCTHKMTLLCALHNSYNATCHFNEVALYYVCGTANAVVHGGAITCTGDGVFAHSIPAARCYLGKSILLPKFPPVNPCTIERKLVTWLPPISICGWYGVTFLPVFRYRAEFFYAGYQALLPSAQQEQHFYPFICIGEKPFVHEIVLKHRQIVAMLLLSPAFHVTQNFPILFYSIFSICI